MKFEIAFFTIPLLYILYNIDYVSICSYENESIVPFYDCQQECSNCIDTSMNKCLDLINKIVKLEADKNITQLCSGGYKCCDHNSGIYSNYCFRSVNNNECILYCNVKYRATLYYHDLNKIQFNKTETFYSNKDALNFIKMNEHSSNFICYIFNYNLNTNYDLFIFMFFYTFIMIFILVH